MTAATDTATPRALTPGALAALRVIMTEGTPADQDRARRILRDHGVLPDPDGDTRARYRAGGPMLFGEELMPGTMFGPRSPLHDWLNAWHLAEANEPPGARCATAAPRGHGKSTAGVEVAALWHAANCTRRFIVIISDSDDQAIARLAAIKAHAEDNEELRRLYPKLRPAFGRLSNTPEGVGEDDPASAGPWRERDIVFACGCRISARGAGSRMRGMKHREHRPDLLLLDDLEDETSVSTPAQLEKRLKWLQRVALGLAGPLTGMSVLWVGTILSRDALLNLATGAAMDEGQQRPQWARAWIARVFRAEVKGTPTRRVSVTATDPETGATFPFEADVGAPMWAALTREMLAMIRAQLGDESYNAEYLADPVSRTGGMIAAPRPASYLNPNDDPRSRVVRLPGDAGIVPVSAMVVAAALDPQFALPGASNDPDLAAVVVVGQYQAWTFILDSWIGRDREQQAAILVRKALAWGAYAAGVEAVAAQVLVADEAAQLAAVAVVPMTPTDGKETRALSLGVRSSQGRLFILPGGHNEELPAYLTAFPHGRYKDPVDATVMATDLATRGAGPAGQGAASPMTGGHRET